MKETMDTNEWMSEDFGGFFVNVSEVAKSKDCLAVTRMLAIDLSNHPYLTVGDFLKGLSDNDLQALVEGAETEDNGEVMLEDLLLISMMLHQSEGLPPIESDNEATDVLNILINYLVCESLARKGLVKVFHENMSFGADCADKIVVQKL